MGKKVPPDKPHQSDQPDQATEDKKKTTRHDVTIRKFEQQFFQLHTVKIKLNKFVRTKQHLHFINQAVHNVNLIAYQAYHLLNLHFLRLLQNKLPIPTSISQTFLQQVCNSVSKLNGHWTELSDDKNPFTDSIKLFREALPPNFNSPDRKKMCNLVNNLAQMMSIAIQNHLNLNFRRRFYRYLKLKYQETDGSKVYYWIDRIFNIKDIKDLNNFSNDPATGKIIQYWKERLQQPKNTNIADKLDIYLPIYYEMAQSFSDHEVKKFTLLPQKGEFIPSYIKICNKSLADLISIWTNGTSPDIMKDKRKYWEDYFYLERFETKNRRFDYEIKTDGYNVDILLKTLMPGSEVLYDLDDSPEKKIQVIKEIRDKEKAEKDRLKAERERLKAEGKKRPKIEKKPKTENKPTIVICDDWEQCLGLDPGKRSLFTTCSNDDQTLRCTRKEYHHRIRLKKFQKKINHRITVFDQRLNGLTFKVTTVEDYLTNLTRMLNRLNEMIKFYEKKFFRKLKFSRYIRKQKTFHQLVNRITNEKITVVGYGNGGSNGVGIKGASMPIKTFRRHLEQDKKAIVVGIDESYTTKMCFQCQEETDVVKHWKEKEKKDGTKKLVLIETYGLRRCKNNECRITWDRDINASQNILLLLTCLMEGSVRPSYLCKKKQARRPSSTSDERA